MPPVRLRLHALLRASGRYARTDMVYLARGSFWLFAGQAAMAFAALLLAVAFANLLPPSVYGEYRYVLSIAGLVSIAALPGMRAALVRAVAKGHESAIYAATRARIRTSLIGAALTLLLAAYYALAGNLTLAAALSIVALTLPFFETFDLYGSYLNGRRRFDVQAAYGFIAQGVSVAVLVATVYATDDLLLTLLAYFVPLALVRYVLYRRTCRSIPRTTDPQAETLTYGRHQTVMAAFGVAAFTVDKFLLWHVLGPVELAVYAFAIALPEQMKGPLKSVGDLALPRFAIRSESDLASAMPQFWRKLALYALAVLALSLAYVAAAPYLYQFLFPAYLESVRYSQLFALSLVAVVGVVPLSLLTAQHKLREQYLLSTLQPLLQISLFVVLIPLYGILGAISAWTGTRLVMLAATCVLTHRAFKRASQ